MCPPRQAHLGAGGLEVSTAFLMVTSQLSCLQQSGGFYSAEDADSPPERGMKPQEGAFYVWTVKEVQQLLPEPVVGASEPLTSGQLLMKHYGFSEAGNISSTQVRTLADAEKAPRSTEYMGSS